VAEAIDWIDAWAEAAAGRASAEDVSLAAAAGRVLARDVASEVDVPGFDRAMMDGLAVVAEDTDGASHYNPLPTEVLGRILPGEVFGLAVTPGRSAWIMTGAAVPPGATAVLPAEQVGQEDDRVQLQGTVPPGKHIGRRGEDVSVGTVVLSAGRRLRPRSRAQSGTR